MSIVTLNECALLLYSCNLVSLHYLCAMLPLSSPQSTVVVPLLLQMVPLTHIKTQLRELRYSSDVTQDLCQLEGSELCVQQIGDGILTLLVLCAHVS